IASIRIHGKNDAPVVEGRIAESVAEGSGLKTVNLLRNASDVDASDALGVTDVTYTVQRGDWVTSDADLPAGVTLTSGGELQPDTGNAPFATLGVGQQTSITVSYTVRETAGARTANSATIHATGVKDAPEKAFDIVKTAREGDESFTFSLLEGVHDVDTGDDLTHVKDSLRITVNGEEFIR